MATISVLILTYNHVRFIAQAMDSVLKQKTRHRIKLVVVEDCSTDGTQAIVRAYAERHPDLITAYLHPQNVGRKMGIQHVVYEGFLKLDGDYIAILEGDDYWSSPDKLEKQLAFLESHPNFVACAHNTVKVYEDGGNEPHRFMYWEEGTKEVHEIRDFVALTSFFHISSLVFRNMRVLKGGSAFNHIRNRWCCDIFFTMAHAQFGKLRYFNEDLSVYRAHSGGNFSNMPALKGRIFNIEGHRRFNQWLGYRYLKEFSSAINRLCGDMLTQSNDGRLPPLSLLQRWKYRSLGRLYGTLHSWLDAKDRLLASRHAAAVESKPRALLLMPVYLAKGVFLCGGAVLKATGTVISQIIFTVVPRIVREAVQRTITKALWHEDIGHLCWLWKEGQLFSDKGAYHFKRSIWFYLRGIKRGCAHALQLLRPKGHAKAVHLSPSEEVEN